MSVFIIVSANVFVLADDEYAGLNQIKVVETEKEKSDNQKLISEKQKKIDEFFKNRNKSLDQNSSAPVPMATGQTYSAYVPLRKQIVGFGCGPASALQTIENWRYYLGTQVKAVPSTTKSFWFLSSCASNGDLTNTAKTNWAHPNGTTSHSSCYASYTDQQVTMITDSGATYDGAASSGVASAINKYLPSNYYTYSRITSNPNDKTYLNQWSVYDLNNHHAPVFLVKLAYLKHYGSSHTGSHFISEYSILDNGDYTTATIGLADCNYTSLGGNYTEIFNDVYTALYNYPYDNIVY